MQLRGKITSSHYRDVLCLQPLIALGNVEFNALSFLEAAIAIAIDGTEMHEHVLAFFRGNKP